MTRALFLPFDEPENETRFRFAQWLQERMSLSMKLETAVRLSFQLSSSRELEKQKAAEQ